MTDFFNYGFNEHTLHLYIHKVTRMVQQYNLNGRESYIKRLKNAENGTPLEQLFASAEITQRHPIPIDLGGMNIPVDPQLIDLTDPLALFFETQENPSSQYLSNGDQILHQNSTMGDVQRQAKQRL
jgi:hypothetical protein